jgi:signal transduction histidine kinase
VFRHASDVGVPRAVIQFAASGLAAVILLGVVGAFVLRRVARSEAVRDARALTQLSGEGIVEPLLKAALLAGDPESPACDPESPAYLEACSNLSSVVQARVLRPPVVRVKVWTEDGRIVYSDEPRLIGQQYRLDKEAQKALAGRTRVAAEISDLSQPENQFDRGFGKLLEVYLPLHVEGGGRVLYEQYLRFDAVAAAGGQLWRSFLPPLVGALLVLELAQLPLAWSLARRLREGQREREALLVRAVEASDVERRRVAADLHDGPVQELAGIAFGLAADADELDGRAPAEATDALRSAATATRRTMRRLRALLFQISPPTLHQAGLGNAISDLLAPASDRGLETRLRVPEPLELPPGIEELLYRAAQEGVRNVLAHADATKLAVDVERFDHRVALTVSDDGDGFATRDADAMLSGRHFGLALLRDLAASVEGSLVVESRPGHGTRLRLEVPVR